MVSTRPPFDPRSPVQDARSPAPILIVAAIAAFAVWTAWQTWPDWMPVGTQDMSPNQSLPPSSTTSRIRQPSTVYRPGSQSLVGLFSADDYPADAADRNEQGTTQVAVTVGTDGRVHRCSVVVSSGSASLDGATCRIIATRARFSPAHDRHGHPVAATFPQSVTWRLED